MLAGRNKVSLKVFYTWEQTKHGGQFDKDFGKQVDWDIPLLEGYNYTFVKNTAADPGVHHFSGIVNPTLNKEIEAWAPDAVLVIRWSFQSHLKCMRYFHKKVPVLFRGDSTLLDKQHGIRRFIRKQVLKWVYSFVDIALFVGKNSKNYFKEYGFGEDRLWHVPHAIDNERFSNEKHYQPLGLEWRHRLGIKEDEIVFLFAGKLESKKNPGLLLNVFSRLNEKGAHLVMVGNGVEEVQLKQQFSSNSRVHFIDFQNQSMMPVMYHMCDVFVLPSKGPEETWGLAINEAMACKRAVLVSNKCGGAIDLVEEGENGYVFNSEDAEHLAAKMKLLIENNNRLQAFGMHSLDIVHHFSFGQICSQIEDLMDQKIKSQ
jgi:glycosyltransferase involved in cell wall biosynthesis